jgi:hypothetical protein
MDILEKLQAIEEIKALKARYFRFCDGKEWDNFEKLFVPDLVCESVDDNPTPIIIKGAQAFLDATKSFLGPSVSIHHGHTPEIDVLSPTEAKGIWVMQDILTWIDGDPLNGFKKIIGWGHYHETYRKVADGWRIATWKLTRVHLDRTK